MGVHRDTGARENDLKLTGGEALREKQLALEGNGVEFDRVKDVFSNAGVVCEDGASGLSARARILSRISSGRDVNVRDIIAWVF